MIVKYSRTTVYPSFQALYLLQLRLAAIEGVTLLDKRGYLTICLGISGSGRVYLRLQEGIRDWFHHLQTGEL